MAEIKVMCARSMHVAVGSLAEAFTRASGHQVHCDFGTVGALQDKLGKGELTDVLISSVAIIDELERAGAVVPGSRRNVAKTFIAVCIREGEPSPAFATADAFKRLLENARAIATSDPAVGGSAGVHLARMFDKEGLTAMLAPKAMPQPTGAEVARRVVEGKAEFGLTLSGEVASVAGAVIAGPVPPPFGLDTTYCAAVMANSTVRDAASAFVLALTHPDTRATWHRTGFELPA